MLNLKTHKDPKDCTIVVAMSGGVDSSVVAGLMKEAGYNVIGITLQLYDHGMTVGKKGACCAGQDIYDAQQVSARLDIPHYVLDYESKFKQSVIDDFVDSYIRGETPLPCVRCNQSVKFKDLVKVAKDLKADALVTGHYVRKISSLNGDELHKGTDEKKDQSYFLFATTKEQLEYLYFPLGGMTKGETRQHAARFGLEIADKPDSQDICFVPSGGYADVVKKIKPDAAKKGVIMHIDGFVLGEHEGIINYTIGQRRGLKIAYPYPLYVVKIDPYTNTVYVGPETSLHRHQFKIKEPNWLINQIDPNYEFTVKVRSTQPGIKAKLTKIDENQVMVDLLSSEKAVTRGQACVVYDGTKVVGGGWIT